MKPSSRPPRTPSTLSDSLQRRLNMYAFAASAAGVSVLALARPAEAKIVYTSAHTVIPLGFPGIVYLDLNRDGIADFKFENWWVNGTDSWLSSLSVFPAKRGNGNGIFGYGTADKLGWIYFPFALRAGAQIGSAHKQSFFSAKWNEWMYRGGGAGQWADVTNRYLGLKFVVKGKTHYGWARLNVHYNPNSLKITAILTGYAYETIPNKAIIAGKEHGADDSAEQPATLGRLALGRK